MPTNRESGVVKWYEIRRGFGFITPDSAPRKEIFVHHTEVAGQTEKAARPLTPGQRVQFDTAPIRVQPGRRAVDVQVIGD